VGGTRGGIILNEDRKKAMQNLKTARGQIDGILKMIDEGRYCVDVSTQIIAAQALLKKANMLILKQHLNHCVKDAFLHDTGEEKVDEIMGILDKIIDK
jgi:DNA-binding FrmR family transcriptional regulator